MGGFFTQVNRFLNGRPEKRKNVSTLRPEQEDLYQQSVNAGLGQGAGGALGDSADYYRNLLSDEGEDFDSFANPQLRQFNENIIPGLSEQFAGMGAGGLSSSGFRNAAVGAGTDLSERLGAMRAGLRQQGAQGLQNIGQNGLQNYSQNMVTRQGSEGFLGSVAPAIGSALGSALGPMGSALGSAAGSWFGGKVGGNSSPYGGNAASNQMSASPQMAPRMQMPSFLDQ